MNLRELTEAPHIWDETTPPGTLSASLSGKETRKKAQQAPQRRQGLDLFV
jgi:hypothetical protein